MVGMGMCLMQMQSQRQYLTQRQRQSVTLRLELAQKLLDPVIPFAVPGLEGMLLADKVLKERNAHGLLIGGLAREVWGQKKKPSDLSAHKDVDVLVIEPEFELTEKFEEGIDWWLPENPGYQLAGMQKTNGTFWINGNHVLLRYGAVLREDIPAGLYIMPRDMALDVQVNYVNSLVNPLVEVETDCEVMDRVRAIYDKEMGECISPCVRESLRHSLLSYKYSRSFTYANAFDVVSFDYDTMKELSKVRSVQ